MASRKNGFLPDTDTELLAWSLNFSTKISLHATDYGLTSAQATAYGLKHTNYATTLAAADPAIRNKPATAAKNAARAALKADARNLAGIIEHTATVTDAQKLELGLTVRAVPSPIPAPSVKPRIDIVSRDGADVTLRLHDGTGSRGRPENVAGASIFSHVGATAPADLSGWRFEANSSKTEFLVSFDTALPAGTVVWFTAFWYSARGFSGPAATPINTVLAGGGVSVAA